MTTALAAASAAPAPAPALPDALTLYRWAVQDPEVHATILALMHAHLNGPDSDPDRPVDIARVAAGAQHRPTAARVLREDFAGKNSMVRPFGFRRQRRE